MTRLMQFANNATSRLAATLSAVGTTVTVIPGDGAKFPTLTAGQYFMATLIKADGSKEVVKVTARASDTLTVVRAAEAVGGIQTAYSFNAADRIDLRLTAGELASELDRLDRHALTGVLNKSANYTAVEANASNLIRVDSTAAACTITLPQISTLTEDFIIAVSKVSGDNNAVYIAGSGGNTINGATPYALVSQWQGAWLVADRSTNTWTAVSSGVGSSFVFVDKFTGTGAQTAFTLTAGVYSSNQVEVTISGVTQNPGIDYTATGTTLTFTTAPPNTTVILARYTQSAPQVTTGTCTIERQVATLGQTGFALANGYIPGSNTMQVFVNGLLLSLGIDYTETGTNAVAFTSGLSAGDEVQFVVYGKTVSAADSANVGYLPAGTGAVATTVQSKLHEFPSIDDYPGADDGAKLTAALAENPAVRIPSGARTSSTTVSIGANQKVFADQPGSTSWTVTTDNQAFVLNGAYSELHDLYVTKTGSHTKNLIEVGTTLIKADRAVLSGVRAVGAGNDGIQVINGNLGTLRDIQSVSNGRDGLNFTTDTADNNAWTFEGHIDLGSNIRDGLNLAGNTSVSNANNSRSHVGTYVTCQSNGRYGAYIGSRSNIFALYLESNVTKDLYFDTYAWGNQIMITQVSGFTAITEVTPGVNEIRTNSMNADYVGGFWNKLALSGRAGKGLIVYNDDGTAGTLALEKTGARTFKLAGGGSGADFTTSFTNDNASFAHSVLVQGAVAPTTDNARGNGTSSARWNNTYSANFRPGNGSPTWTSGSGTPEGVLSAAVGSLYTRIDGGASTTLYVKESGAGTTGWRAV